MSKRRCDTCRVQVEVREVSPGRFILQPHEANCGNVCIVGSADAPGRGPFHGEKGQCPKCGAVQCHWFSATGGKR